MVALPTGTVTFFFTDIEGSTRLWEGYPDAMRHALAVHDQILREEVTHHGGHVFKTVGDAVYAVFAAARDAIAAARSAQQRLTGAAWEVPEGLRVRMAIHTGTAEQTNEDYLGPPLNRLTRLLSAAHGARSWSPSPRGHWWGTNCRRTPGCRTMGCIVSKTWPSPGTFIS